MTNDERKEVIDKIQKEIKEKKLLGEKYEELKRLSQDPKVVKYLSLLGDIDQIEKNMEKYRNPINGSINDSLEERIKFWFRVCRFSCDHDVWLYAGSYYSYTNFENEEDFVIYHSENLGDSRHVFSHNKYVCLECGKKVDIPKSCFEEFEDSHFVLKSQEYIDIEYYQNLYYQFLYHNYDFSDARKLVIDIFNKINNKSKTKVLSDKSIRK